MAKRKIKKQLPPDHPRSMGYVPVPETSGYILDGIWHNPDKEILMIRFADGRILYHKPLEPKDLIISEK